MTTSREPRRIDYDQELGAHTIGRPVVADTSRTICRPTYPLGCATQWGKVIGGPLPDMQEHCCDLPSSPEHTVHRCVCGSTEVVRRG